MSAPVAIPTAAAASKRVHFAADVHYPPRTPSPTWSEASSASSSSSSGSSDGPCTPPVLSSMLPPAAEAADETKPAQIHGALAFRPSASCLLAYDVSVHPSKLAPPPGMTPAQLADVLAQPATHPALPAMTLVSAALAHPVTVRPAGADKASATSSPQTPASELPATPASAFVTVYDVLASLYASLRTPLSPDEYNALAKDHQREVARAYGTRVESVSDRKREAERAKGVKRIDLILAAGTSTFNGLGATKRSRALWVLNLRI